MDTDATTRLEFFVSCKHLPKMDTFSKSDPFVVLFTEEAAADAKTNWKYVDRSETLSDNQDPHFKKQFVVDYYFEEIQNMRLAVFDEDEKDSGLSRQDYIGEALFSLAELATSQNQVLEKPLQNSSKRGGFGSIIIQCEELATCKQSLNIQFKGVKLDKKDFFGKSDPYLEILRLREDGSWMNVFATEVIKNTLKPRWKEIDLSLATMCNGDMHRPLKLRCWDWNKNSDPDFIGETSQTSCTNLLKPGYSLDLINAKLQSKKSLYNNSGKIVVESAKLNSHHSFMDYIRGGCEIGMIVAVDFTASNGDPSDSQSLHFRHGYNPNEYQTAIRSIGEVVAPYDTDQKFPVWGFGGRINDGPARHCFPLTFDEERQEVVGVDGILNVYNHAMNYVKLSGPTLFAEIINSAAAMASVPMTQEKQQYTILLILTDGVVNDLQNSVNAIVAASKLPISIIIVGVGSADFSAMEFLDSDDRVLKSSTGHKAERDIVQFVPMRNFAGKSPAALAKQTLAEVPGQLLSFMSSKGITPKPLPS